MSNIIPKVQKEANFGTNEPFVARIVMGLSDVLNVTDYKNKDEIREAIMGMFMNGLSPAFTSLRELQKIENGEKELLLMELRKEYFSFYDRLWASYKDHMQKVIRLLGYNMGFVFKNDKEFKKGIKEFRKKHIEVPIELMELIKENRIAWQTHVAKFRNDYAQHQTVFEDDVKELLSVRTAEICFENCWTLIENILAHLMCTKIYGWVRVAEIPKEKRDPAMPKKFQILYK